MIDANSNLVIVDVREQYEYCSTNEQDPPTGHIPGSLNYPWSSGALEAAYPELPVNSDILVVCRSGGRSAQASAFLCSHGYNNVFNMTGGMLAWQWETVGCCFSQAECDDGLFCTGQETCVNLNCLPGTAQCEQAYFRCEEDNDTCVECADDYDCDGISDNADNCFTGSDIPNGFSLGTCVREVFGVMMGMGMKAKCADDIDCNSGEICQMNQEDYNTNGAGDACECYADIDHSLKVSSGDLLLLKIQYNRTDCAANPCSADMNHDNRVNSNDLLIMKYQYNRTGCPEVP